MKKMQEIAIEYLKKYGYSVIPVNQNKEPLIPWKIYQERLPTALEVASWWNQFPDAGIGIVTGEISNIVVIDIDDLKTGEKSLSKFISDNLITPMASTPRGGRHLYFRPPPGKKLYNNTKLIPGCDFRANGGYVVAPPSSNGNGRGYQWLSGLSIYEVEPVELPSNYVDFIVKEMSKPPSVSLKDDEKPFIQGRRDNDLFHVANSLVKGGCDLRIAKRVIEDLAKRCEPPVPATEALKKLESALNRSEKKDRNLSEEVRRFVMNEKDVFTLRDCYKALGISGKDEITVRVVLSNMLKEKNPIIEKAGGIGIYRVINQEFEKIDFLNADRTALPVELPLGIHEKFNFYRSNVIVLAGSPNTGKTAFCLNTAWMNKEKFKVRYIMSEMDATELAVRLYSFKYPIEDWSKIEFIKKHNDFRSAIDPNGFNIIDYVMVKDEFWKIGGIIDGICERLVDGVALVAIQKPVNRTVGYGGEMTLFAARLYLSLSNDTIEIIKGKLWKNGGQDTLNTQLKFKLVDGAFFKPTSFWMRPGQNNQPMFQ